MMSAVVCPDSVAAGVPMRLSELTTFRVGGTFDRLVRVASESEFISTLRGVDAAGLRLLVIGGGSNIVADDTHFAGVLVQDMRREYSLRPDASEGRVRIEVSAGAVWDDFVAWTVEQGFGGVELLSGIPGSVGASPVQNIGAYGCEVQSAVFSVRLWDRVAERVVECSASEMGFAYRDSMIKRSMRSPEMMGGLLGPTGRWVVLSVTFDLSSDGLSAPVRYGELARVLGVEGGARVPVSVARDAVLSVRRSKGMVLDAEDHDSWSAGSFFMNPIVSAEVAASLPADAPRFPVGSVDGVEFVKTSAAWLITNAGFDKGFRVREGAAASLSSKHSLALTNRGGASCADVVELARVVQSGVCDTFGMSLFPEPVAVGFSWEDFFAPVQYS